MSYGISFTSGALIPSFCLSIKGRHDAPSLSLCSDGKKSDLALYVYEILLFLSALFGGHLLNLTVVLLMLPMNIWKHLLRIVSHSICQDGIKDSYQLTADCNHGLFLLKRNVRSCRLILMQWLKLQVLRYQRNRCIEQYCPQLTQTSFAYGRLSFVLFWAVLP